METQKKPSPNVGDLISADNANWKFDEQVTEHFCDHARRSIPLYEEGHQLVVDMSDFFLPTSGRCYELGCSRGELLIKLEAHHKGKNIEWLGIDNSPSMITAAKSEAKKNVIQWNVDDICSMDFLASDLIIAYYTVQFVAPRMRQELINRIYQSLNWGGALILFEKVRGPDARFQDMLTTLYSEFKLHNGYSPDEIVHKTRSLKGILEPFSTQGNLDLLQRAGFQDITTVMKYLCFEGFLAIK